MMTETVVNVQEAPNNNAANKTQTQGDRPLSWIKINVDYFRTTPGMLKIAEFILGILCMSLASPAYAGGTHYFLFVATVSFIGTLIWMVIYLLGIREAINFPINWIMTEFVNTAGVTFFYTLAFIVQLAVAGSDHRRGTQYTAGVLGLFNTLVYGFASYLLYIQVDWKNASTTTTTTTRA